MNSQDADTNDPDITTTDWVPASGESHLKAMKFVNRAFSEKGGPSELRVTFRERTSSTGKVYPEATYKYESFDHLSLRQTFEKMTVAEHPGIILHAELIRPGNKGTRM